MTGRHTILARLVWLVITVAFVSSCTSLPEDYDKPESHTLTDTGDTWLANRATELSQAHSALSGFRLLPDGSEALGARLMLADRAEVSIDVQYYIFHRDLIGKLLLGRLTEAADRGVRVRILLDDIETEGYEQLFAALSAHDHIEVRLANPFAYRNARGLNFLTDFQRVNHRMHNKSITFDNVVTVFGGRNIATEYFGANEVFNYRDLDILGVGQVAADVSVEFDKYWNAGESMPVEAFVEPDASEATRQELRDSYTTTVAQTRDTPYAGALAVSHSELLLLSTHSELIWAPARVVYDLPYGEENRQGEAGPSILSGILIEAIETAERELFLVSPYFVPGESGVEQFRRLRDRGVRCVVVTNSLASTDVESVYGGYANYQKALLEAGVELWEVMAYPLQSGYEQGLASERRILHAKTFTIDRQILFVGSFNWDPRSQEINTEMGAMINTPELASQLMDSVAAALPYDAWQLRLSDDGDIEWLAWENGELVIYSEPPQAETARKLKASASGLKALEGQL